MQASIHGVIKFIIISATAISLSGCLSYSVISNTSSGNTVQKEWRSDTITGLSLAADSNGTKGYVFVGESLDYLLTEGGEGVIKLLNDPEIKRQNIQVSGMTKFILSSGRKSFRGALTLNYIWDNVEEKERVARYGFICDTQKCTLALSNLKGTIHKKSRKADYSSMMAFYHPFKVGFYEYKSSGGIPQGLSTALLPVTVTLDIVTLPLQFVVFYAATR